MLIYNKTMSCGFPIACQSSLMVKPNMIVTKTRLNLFTTMFSQNCWVNGLSWLLPEIQSFIESTLQPIWFTPHNIYKQWARPDNRPRGMLKICAPVLIELPNGSCGFIIVTSTQQPEKSHHIRHVQSTKISQHYSTLNHQQDDGWHCQQCHQAALILSKHCSHPLTDQKWNTPYYLTCICIMLITSIVLNILQQTPSNSHR